MTAGGAYGDAGGTCARRGSDPGHMGWWSWGPGGVARTFLGEGFSLVATRDAGPRPPGRQTHTSSVPPLLPVSSHYPSIIRRGRIGLPAEPVRGNSAPPGAARVLTHHTYMLAVTRGAPLTDAPSLRGPLERSRSEAGEVRGWGCARRYSLKAARDCCPAARYKLRRVPRPCWGARVVVDHATALPRRSSARLAHGVVRVGGVADRHGRLVPGDELGEEVRRVLGVAHVADDDLPGLHALQEREVTA